MTVYIRTVTFSLALTAADPQTADRDAKDMVEAVVEGLERRDAAHALTVGEVTVTGPAAAVTDWQVAYGSGPLALAKVEEWRSAGLDVDSREVNGLLVHRPVQASAPETRAAA